MVIIFSQQVMYLDQYLLNMVWTTPLRLLFLVMVKQLLCLNRILQNFVFVLPQSIHLQLNVI